MTGGPTGTEVLLFLVAMSAIALVIAVWPRDDEGD